jgi:hypothetical protein
VRVGTKSEKEKMLQESRKGKNEKKERKKKERERNDGTMGETTSWFLEVYSVVGV